MKYLNYKIVFEEIPDEITLALNITNCPHRCRNCHSPELRKDIGTEITEEEISRLITENSHITCICFMGGDSSHEDIMKFAKIIHQKGKLAGMYSGDKIIDEGLMNILDYYKVGPYIEKFGPLNKKTTNQKLFKIYRGTVEDITYKFWKKDEN